MTVAKLPTGKVGYFSDIPAGTVTATRGGTGDGRLISLAGGTQGFQFTLDAVAQTTGMTWNKYKKGFTWKNPDGEVFQIHTVKDNLVTAVRPKQFFANGGMVMPKGYADGGGIFGTDTVPAMLTPGEFVVKKSAVDAIGIDKLNSINSGTASSESVYNYSINVNVSSAANADDIARTVMTQIRQTESQRVRSNTY